MQRLSDVVRTFGGLLLNHVFIFVTGKNLTTNAHAWPMPDWRGRQSEGIL